MKLFFYMTCGRFSIDMISNMRLTISLSAYHLSHFSCSELLSAAHLQNVSTITFAITDKSISRLMSDATFQSIPQLNCTISPQMAVNCIKKKSFLRNEARQTHEMHKSGDVFLLMRWPHRTHNGLALISQTCSCGWRSLISNSLCVSWSAL